MRTEHRQWYALGALILLFCWVYVPGLSGPFVFDDHTNIAQNPYLKIDEFSLQALWQASWSSNSGHLKRPLAMFSFAIDSWLSGMSPMWMKITNLLIHIVNVILIYVLLSRLMLYVKKKYSDSVYAKGTASIPLVVTSLWALHPINVTAVSYIVQRMTSLFSLFILLGTICYLDLRTKNPTIARRLILSGLVLVFWTMGLLSKETALSFSLYILVIEIFILRFSFSGTTGVNSRYALLGLILAPWIIAGIYAFVDNSFIVRGYQQREFTLQQRILTESRIMVDYIRLILLPDVSNLGLFHDDIRLSTSILQPVQTLISLLFLLSLLVAVIFLRQRYFLFSFGMAWFFAGHLLESTVFPLELMYLHRNYLPGLGLILATVSLITTVPSLSKGKIVFLFIFALVALSLTTRLTTYHWSSNADIVLAEALNKPDSIRANVRAGRLLLKFGLETQNNERKHYRDLALKHFGRVSEIDRADSSGLIMALEARLRFGETPGKHEIESLARHIESSKIKSLTVNAFTSLSRCAIANQCLLNDTDYLSISNKLLNKSNTHPQKQSEMLGITANYHAEKNGNYSQAAKMLEDAILLSPGMLELYELLAFYYYRQEKWGELEVIVNKLERRDAFGVYRYYIEESRKLLTELDTFNTQGQQGNESGQNAR